MPLADLVCQVHAEVLGSESSDNLIPSSVQNVSHLAHIHWIPPSTIVTSEKIAYHHFLINFSH